MARDQARPSQCSVRAITTPKANPRAKLMKTQKARLVGGRLTTMRSRGTLTELLRAKTTPSRTARIRMSVLRIPANSLTISGRDAAHSGDLQT